MLDRTPLPSWADWCDAAAGLDLVNRSGELVGPCPSCGGTDRFHVSRRGPDALVGCRGCVDGGASGFAAVLRAAFPDRGRGESRPVAHETALPRSEPRSAQAEDPRIGLTRALWRSTTPPDATPGRTYLAARDAWPPRGIGPDLPATVRWLAADAAPAVDRAAKWYGLPPGAAGSIVFAWRSPAAPDRWPSALSLLAVSADGERLRWPMGRERGPKMRTVGARGGLVFEARPGADAEPVHLCEGEVDALGLALAPWTGPGRVLAAGGTGNMRGLAGSLPGVGPVVLHADADGPGGAAAGRVRAAVLAAGRECRIETYGPGEDPASALAGDVGERAAVREFDGGLSRDEATADAWRDVLGVE